MGSSVGETPSAASTCLNADFCNKICQHQTSRVLTRAAGIGPASVRRRRSPPLARRSVDFPRIFLRTSSSRYLLWVTQYYFWFPLVEKYLSRDADLLFAQRNLWCSEFRSVASKNDRCEALIRVWPARDPKRLGGPPPLRPPPSRPPSPRLPLRSSRA